MSDVDVKKIAVLANLPITADQEDKLTKAFVETLKTVDMINKLDTKGVSTTSRVSTLTNVTRKDEIDEKRVINIGNYFKVKAIFNQE